MVALPRARDVEVGANRVLDEMCLRIGSGVLGHEVLREAELERQIDGLYVVDARTV